MRGVIAGIAEFAGVARLENDGLENDGVEHETCWNLQDWKITDHQKSGVEFAELKLLPVFVCHIYFWCDCETWRREYYCH